MTTTFEHKYNLGDEVWVMLHEKPTKTKVQQIKAVYTIPMYSNKLNGLVNPYFELFYAIGDEVIHLGGLPESALFPTEQALLDSL